MGGVFELVFFVVMELLTFLFLPITVLVSIVTLVFSAADRYFALTFPFKYKTTNTKKIAKVISTLIWVIITSVYITFFLFKAEQSSLVYSFVLQPCSNCTTKSVTQRFNMIVIFFLFLLWVFTVLTLFSLKNNYEKSKKLNRRAQKAFAAEKQMSFILILMVFAFTFSLLPTMYNYTYSTFFKNNLASNFYPNHPVSNFIYASFLATNSIWNIIIYNVFNKNFRVAFVKLYKDTFKCLY